MIEKALKVPLIRISKKNDTPFVSAIITRVIAVVIGLIVCGIVVMLITGGKTSFFGVFEEMFKGAFGTLRKFKLTLRETTALLCIGLALVPAFKMKFWNIGGEGQALMGVLASITVLKIFPDMPNEMLLLTMFVASVVGGAIWALIPAFFRAFWKTNETLFTLMMNYVAIQLMAFFIVLWESAPGIHVIKPFTIGYLPKLFGVEYGWNIVIVFVLTIIMFVFMKYSKQGYEISVVGESENTAKYIGINVRTVILKTMAISGGLCGIAGFLLVAGSNHTMNIYLVGGFGFTAIIVAWLAKLNPFYMILTSFYVIFLGIGTDQIASTFNLNDYASDAIIGIALFFVLGCEFFLNYKITFRKNSNIKEVG